MIRASLIATMLSVPLLLSSGCQRGAGLEVELLAGPAVSGEVRVIVVPMAVELLDARGALFRLQVAQPKAVDLAAPGSTPLRLELRGRVPAGRYIGLRLVLDDLVRHAQPGVAETALAVDQTGAFAAIDLELVAEGQGRLTALIDLDASLVRRPPLPDVRHFLPQVREVAESAVPDAPFR